MRLFKFGGKTAEVTDKDYAQIKERFDPAELQGEPGWGRTGIIAIPCPLCNRFLDLDRPCRKCPMDVFHVRGGKPGCMQWLLQFSEEWACGDLALFSDRVEAHTREGLEILQKLYDGICSVKKKGEDDE